MKKSLFLIFLLVPFISFSQSEIDNARVGTIDNKSNLQFRPGTFDAKNQLNPFIFLFENRVLNHGINADQLFNNYLMVKMILNDSTQTSRIQFSPFNQGLVQPGLGYYNNIGISSLLMPVDNLFIEGNAFLSLQKTLFTSEILYGVRGVLSYNLTYILQFQLWGQYISPSKYTDPVKVVSGLYPKTSVGGAVIAEPSKNVKIGVGVEYQHNQRNQKWESRSGGKVAFGF